MYEYRQILDGPGACAFVVVPVFEFLHGTEWGPVVAAFIYGLKPSEVRVIEWNGEEKTDARIGRVTVHLGPLGKVIDIEQEMIVGLNGTGARDGGELARKVGLL